VRRRALAGPLLGLALATAAPALEVPFLAGRVNDRAELLKADTVARVEEKLAAFERETGAQVAVLTIPSLEDEILEEYSLRVAETWALGRAGTDDGVLFLISRDDRKMRIEVGYGLEGRLTDLTAGRILDEIVAPRFKRGDFDVGVEVGIDAILDAARGNELPALERGARPRAVRPDLVARLIGLGIFTVNVGVFSLIALFSSGFSSWFLYAFLMPFYLAFPSALIAPAAGPVLLGLWVVGFPLLKWFLRRSAIGKRWLEARPKLKKALNNPSTWSWSSGRGGGFSSGGFSGGGGSFGGGGSSGGW
jgi:uncharacterized protein